jgi:hypothetical protein
MAGCVCHNLAHHFTDQQVGQEATLAASTDDDQVAAQLPRLLYDFLVRLFTPAKSQVDGHADGPRTFSQFGEFDGGIQFGLRSNLGRQGFIFRIAHQWNHRGQWQLAALGQGEGHGFGPGVEFAVFGGQQQPVEQMRHGQCPPVSRPDAASTRTIVIRPHIPA